MSVDLRWENPPADGRSNREWTMVAEALQQRPGEWALVSEEASGGWATRAKKGAVAAFRPAGAYEFQTQAIRETKPLRFKVWGRYVGTEATR